jgi:hypothetical protein
MLGANCAEKGLARRARGLRRPIRPLGIQAPVTSAELILPASALQQNWMIDLDSCYNRVTYEGYRPLSRSQDALQRLAATGPER